MANNSQKIIKPIGTRLNLVDPNNFEYQYAGNSFDDNSQFNMSVPNEDLCIIVELKTNQTSRTVLNSNNSNFTVNNTNAGNSKILVNFIGGKNDSTVTNDPKSSYLTTSYTDVSDISTNNNAVDEALGITSIDIEFNSQYAPMININFIDIRGAAIFQNGAKSKYGVFFKLPYPIFQLKIKGYYGKPVVYCLHMIKCTTKFNSQTGNFEIAAQFVGYTYAMLSDMILGYMRAAEETTRGKELLSSNYSGIPSINKLLSDIGNIDRGGSGTDIPPELDKKIKALPTIQSDVSSIKTLITSTINSFNTSNTSLLNSGNANDPSNSNTYNISILNGAVDDKTLQTFSTDFNKLLLTFDTDVRTNKFLDNLQYSDTTSDKKPNVLNIKLNDLINPTNKVDLYNTISSAYNVDSKSTDILDEIIKNLINVSNSISDKNSTVFFYDFNSLLSIYVNNKNSAIDSLNKDLNLQLVSAAETNLKSLNVDTSIRGMLSVFTTGIEIFLQQLIETSQRYQENNRVKELLGLGIENLDILNNKNNKNNNSSNNPTVIYPWPEYVLNGEETYIGGPNGVKNPDNVPEIQLVNALYQGFKENELVNNSSVGGPNTANWFASNPVDSSINFIGFNETNETNPYNRLGNNATNLDIINYIVIRAVTFLGFSNRLISEAEITNSNGDGFADKEAANFISAYQNNNNLISAVNLQLNSIISTNSILDLKINDVQIFDSNNNFRGSFVPIKSKPKTTSNVNTSNTSQTVTANFFEDYHLISSDITNEDIKKNDFYLNNLFGPALSADKLDKSPFDGGIGYDPNTIPRYLDFIDKNQYDTQTPNVIKAAKPINFKKLSDLKLTPTPTPDNLIDVGFLANAGKYGVQEFTTIDYSNSIYTLKNNATTLYFYSLFFDNAINPNTNIGYLTYPRNYDGVGYTTDYDIKNNNFKEITSSSPYVTIDELNSIFIAGPNKSQNTTPNYNTRQNFGANIQLISDLNNAEYPYATFSTASNILNNNEPETQETLISLFGSRLYNKQSITGQTFLFLHSLPWRGLIYSSKPGAFKFGIFNDDKIRSIFKYRTGFIQVPKLFPAFIGGLLLRYQEGLLGKDIIDWGPSNDNYIPVFNSDSNGHIPKTDEYLRVDIKDILSSMAFGAKEFSNYAKLEDTLLNLPQSVKDSFIQEFLNFSLTYDNDVNQYCQIKPKSTWENSFKNIVNGTKNVDTILNNFDLPKNGKITDYKVITYANTVNDANNNVDYWVGYSLFLEYADGSSQSKILKNLIFDYTYISNDSYLIWSDDIFNDNYNNGVTINYTINIPSSVIINYLKAFKGITNTNVTNTQSSSVSQTQELAIKFETYRTLKKIYEKWINVLENKYTNGSNDVIFQCCTQGTSVGDRLKKDTDIAKNLGGYNTPRLIDSFRFLDKNFNDISKLFNINPLSFYKMIINSPNINFYDMAGRILTDNHFNFIALPSFVDYNNPDEVVNMFTPYTYYEASTRTVQGPSFVCVYVGQTSTKLDFDNDQDYGHPNDGFDLNGKNLPQDFSNLAKDWEDVHAAFVVRYGQQNQNIFKDVKLDQAEFSETAESLLVVDNIANSLGKTNLTYAGQNLYDVYSVRSYKAEVEMLGNAMIQPMMYFQLENIPLFHGAYLITKVTHSIKPNHMSTTFNGTRIKSGKTPLLTQSEIVADLLTSYGYSVQPQSIDLTKNYVDKYHAILYRNLPSNNTIVRTTGTPISTNLETNVPKTALAEYKTFGNGTYTTPKMNNRINDYFNKIGSPDYTQWSAAFISYVMYSADNTFPINESHCGYVTQAMNGESGYEVFPLNSGLKIKAEVGDILTFSRPGGFYKSHSNVIYEVNGNVAKLMGGNVRGVNGNTVNISTITLDDGFITDNVKFPVGNDYKLLTKNTGGVYYDHKTNLSDYPIDSVNQITSINTKQTSKQLSANQLTVKNFFKDYFTSYENGKYSSKAKEITAGIMGNIQAESDFNPTQITADSNHQYAFGLIQWNGIQDIFKQIGNVPTSRDKATAASQMGSIVGNDTSSQLNSIVNNNGKNPDFKNYVKQLSIINSANDSAFFWANKVEICDNCKRRDSPVIIKRQGFANDFFNRFNNQSDPLAW